MPCLRVLTRLVTDLLNRALHLQLERDRRAMHDLLERERTRFFNRINRTPKN